MPIHMRMRKLRGPHMKKSMPFEQFGRTHTQPVNLRDLEERFDDGAEVTPAALSEPRPRDPEGRACQDPRCGRPLEEADRDRTRLLEDRPREDRGRRRHLHTPGRVTNGRHADISACPPRPRPPAWRLAATVIGTLVNSVRIPEIRKKLLFTAAMLALYRIGSYIPAPGINTNAVKQISDNFGGSNVLGFLNLFSGGSLQRFAIFALGIMPYITASIILQLLQVVVPSLEKLRKEGEVGQQKITQYTRYLTVGLAFAQSIGYVFLFRPVRRQRQHLDRQQLHVRRRLRDRARADDRLRAGDVARRADHPARHRQRHLADDLREHRRAAAARDPGVVDEPGPDLQGDDAVPRARDHRGDRVHPGGPAPDPRAVREARGGPEDGRRRVHLPAAAREHGRRDPGDLRGVADGVPADDRRARRTRAGCRPSSARTAPPTWSASRS